MFYVKIALLQIRPTGTLEGNLQKGVECCIQAKTKGADIALFPEMWSTGYNMLDAEPLATGGISIQSSFVSVFCTLAKDLDMAIGISLLEKHESACRNTFCLIDRHGSITLNYAKVHTCDFGDEHVLTAGDNFYVACLDTAGGIVKIGAMICYDREFPESARLLMLKGAEIILVPNACPMEINRLAQLRARAYENMVGIATCNYPSPYQGCNGHSTAFDGIAYSLTSETSRDMLMLEAGEDEGIFVADFNIDELREYRSCEVHGNAYRRPQKYKLLISEQIVEPFIRKDRRK